MNARGWCGALLALLGLVGCRGPGRLDDVIEREVERAAERSSPRMVVGSLDDERWQPDTALPRFHLLPRAEIAALDAYAAGCGEAPEIHHGALRKALTWARFRCGQARLPDGFFAEPPFVHPDGRSYAWHARGCSEEACKQAARAPELHHVLERSLVDPAGWPPLDRAALVRLRAGEPFASVGSTLLVRRSGAYVPVRVAAVARANPRVGVGSGASCDSNAFGRCWVDLDRRRSGALARGAASLAAAVFGAALAAVVAWRVRTGRKLAAERAFVLRWLAHELRTPVTALKLEVEGLRDGFDELPADAQDRFLTIARGVTRLQRVVEASTVYLRSQAARGEPARQVGSLRAFVEAVADEAAEGQAGGAADAEPASDEGPVAVDAPDAPVELPVHTTALALRNLIRNALAHGKPPCGVRASADADGVRFEVRDAGQLSPETIRSLGTPFVRAGSEGLGIGLYLAHHAAASAGGSLRASRDPTCFLLHIPRRRP